MFYCRNCKNEFEEPKICQTSYEEHYGCTHLFADTHTMTIEECPYCKSDDFEEMKKCDNCGEYCRECDLQDTEQFINGGVGCLCYDCLNDMK